MKSKTFLLMCLFIVIGITELPAQNGTADHTFVYKWTDQVVDTWPITCDGSTYEMLSCYGDMSEELHGAKGEPVWFKIEANWTALSTSGESFKGHELYKGVVINFDPVTGVWSSTGTCRAIIIGDWGSRYKITLTFLWTPEAYTWSFVDIKCF